MTTRNQRKLLRSHQGKVGKPWNLRMGKKSAELN